jgi:hypothetical protein
MGLVTHPVRKSRAPPKKESIICVFIIFLLLLFRDVEARENVFRHAELIFQGVMWYSNRNCKRGYEYE